MLDFCKPDDQWRVHRLQGEFAALEVQLKELREELCGEQQTNHQMTFCEAKLAEKLQGECAAMDMQLKELRRELRGEQQTYHQMTFSEAKLAEKFPALELDLANLRAKQEVSERRLAKLSAKALELQKEQQRYEQVVFNERQLKQQLELQEDSARRRELLLGEESRRRTEQAQAEAQGLIARVQELQDLERERYTAEVQAKKKELQRLATLQIEKEDFLQQIGDLQARLAQEQQAGKFLASQRMAAAKVQASVTEEMREILAERETDDAHQEARQRACAEELMDLRLDLELKTAAVAMSKERKPFVWRESPKPARSVGSSRARAARAESPRVVTQEAENKQTAAVPTVADELVALDEALKSFQAATEQGIKKAQQDSKTTELLLRGRLARAEAVSMRLQRELQVSEAQRNLGGTFQVLVMEAEEAQKAEAIGAEASGAEIEEPSSEERFLKLLRVLLDKRYWTPLDVSTWWREALALLVAGAWRPNVVSFSAAVSAAEKGRNWKMSLQLFGEAQRAGIFVDVALLSSVMAACDVGGCWQEALALLHSLRSIQVNLVSFNAALSACARQGCQREKQSRQAFLVVL
eukprot:g22405.t1